MKVRQLRWVLVAITVVCFIAGAINTVRDLGGTGQAGFVTAWPETTISAVKAGSVADSAGLRPGDTLLLDRMSLHDALRAVGLVERPPGSILHVTVQRGTQVHDLQLTLRNAFVDQRLAALTILSLVEGFLIALLVIAVLVRCDRPQPHVFWAFASGAFIQYQSFTSYLGDEGVVALILVASATLNLIGTAGLLLLALQATGDPSRWRIYQRVAIGAGLLTGAVVVYCNICLLVFRTPAPRAVIVAAHASDVAIYGVVFVIVVTALLRSSGMARIRTRWLCAGLGAIVLNGLFADGLAVVIPTAQYSIWPGVVSLTLNVVGFAALGFSIVRNELFDVGFVINRTAIYTATTAILIASFAALNWFAGLVLKSTGMALPIEIILAGVLGLSLNLVHRRIDKAIDRLFFRSRYEALTQLRRVARGLVHATDLDVVAESAVREVCEALELSGGALYRQDADGVFQRLAEYGWPPEAAAEIGPGDPLLVHLAGATEYLRLDGVPHEAAFPHGQPRPRIAFPLWSRGQLAGVALVSAHRTGAALDPEEIEAIEGVIGATVSAFDRVDAEALRSAMEEVHALRAERDLLLAKLNNGYAPGALRASELA